MELVLAHDIEIATETSRLDCLNLGEALFHRMEELQRLSRPVERGKTSEVILAGEITDAYEASRIRLLHGVVSEEEGLKELHNKGLQ